MNVYLTTIFVLVLNSLVHSQEEAPLITIPDGQIKGTSGLTAGKNIKFYAYRGIPFAKPPIGELRFAAPVKNDPWNGTLDATEDQESCLQMNSRVAFGEVWAGLLGSEDCLYINVYTTDVHGSLPVMVWIYGGAFVFGWSTTKAYPPDNFLDKDVIFVSFNYRLGVFGFLSTEDESASGNWGIKDQVMALRWVKDNIQHFGGDPNKITIFGESAGGVSVSYLAQTNLTNGLFNGAIMESGTSLCPWALTRDARHKAFMVGRKLGIFTLNSQSLVRRLREVNYRDLKYAEANVSLIAALTDNILAGIPFGVVTEPDIPGAVVSKRSWELLSTGQFPKGPAIIGFNSNEGSTFTAYLDLLRPAFIQYELDVSRLAPYDLTQNALKKLGAGTDIRRHYFGLIGSLTGQPKALTWFVSMDQFNRPIREAVKQVSKFTTVYYYQFSYSGLLADPDQSRQDVGHTDELPYLFNPKSNVSESDFMTSQRLVTLWTNFAKTGNPTPDNNSDDDNVLSGITWEPNDPTTNSEASIKYLNINNSLSMESNPFQEDWSFYQGIYDRFGDPPYTTY